MISQAHKLMVAARTGMLMDDPFWGQLSMRLALKEDPACETAWVDGQTLGFNPAFAAALTYVKRIALFAHEVMHCAMGHPWRRGGRDPRRWNEACDRSINPILRAAGYVLPDGALFELDPSHLGKSAEWIYDRLPRTPKQEGGGGQDKADPNDPTLPDDDIEPGEGEQDLPDPLGEVRDAPSGADEVTATEEEWKQAVVQAAAMARSRGDLPAGLDRVAQTAAKSRVDWRSATRRWAQEVGRADYTWRRPSARYLARGLYLPSLHSEEMGVMVVGIDTSGSIDLVLLGQFGNEVQAMAEELKPRRIIVMHCDAAIARTEVFEQGDPIVLHPAGGGGTDFRPVFDAVAEMDEQPVCVLYLTDLYGTFPSVAPDVPVLWVTAREEAVTVPFGEVVSAA